LESTRSAALMVTMSPVAGRSRVVAATAADLNAVEDPSANDWPAQVTTRDGIRLRLEKVSDAVTVPTDIAIAPDGRLFVAEDGGSVRVVKGGQLLAQPALSLRNEATPVEHLLALAVDPLFQQNHYIYAIYTGASPSGERVFHLVRFREALDTLADRAVIR